LLPPELDPRGRSRKRKRGMPARLANVLLVTLSAVVLLVSVGGYAVVKWFNGSIARVHLSLGPNRPAEAPKGSENWLLVGTDSGVDPTGEYGVRSGQRSDTTILVHLDADGTTTNVSFPRDTMVTIPEHLDPAGKTVAAKKDKFNSAIEQPGKQGGASLLVRTVQDLTHIRVDHYVSVDLNGFKKISEAVDGVEVCIKPYGKVDDSQEPDPVTKQPIYHHDTNIDDSYSHFHGKVGPQKVVGDQALAFVRQRHGLPDSDISRIQRQQQFLGSVFRAATAAHVLFNPIRVTKLLAAFEGALTLDYNTSLSDLENLALRLKGVDASKVRFETIPQRPLAFTDTDLGLVVPFNNQPGGIPTITPNGQSYNIGSVQILEQAPFQAMMAAIGGGDGSTRTPGKPAAKKSPTVTAVTVPPSQILVTVENGVGRTGLAGQVTQALGQQAFRTGAPGPADNTNYASSEVHYSGGNKDAAETVAAAIPGSVLRLDPTATNGIVLIVGANYTSVRAVTIGDVTPAPTPSATVTPSSTPSASPALVTADSADNRCTY
jgi:LCP family protein required for cell wall assembly